MNNFIFENKTKVYFGKGGVKEYLGSLLGNYGETVMLAYGGGSIKRNGVYDEIMGILNAAGKRIVEFSGIMSNPTYAKVQEGAKLARENHVLQPADNSKELLLPSDFLLQIQDSTDPEEVLYLPHHKAPCQDAPFLPGFHKQSLPCPVSVPHQNVSYNKYRLHPEAPADHGDCISSCCHP